jgi:hypothetical protein
MEVADFLEQHLAKGDMPCEMCDAPGIRFVHVLEHDDHGEAVGVCVACSERMTGDTVNPRKVEASVRKKSEARDRWLAGHWYLSVRENWVTHVDGLNMGVFPVKFQDGKWSYRIGEKFFKGMYPSVEAAKYALFDELWKQRRG